ncbi:MAG: malectin domain-containing carbohydrate-binding protein [candidate division KSB1 bacterium]|nr:malectin domain-containing carbohydrate-binding protein [candidate division KSB1 bacterium]MDZ7318077.1 malectin domain-containing carbohydrate-binding protein [candidate division KSB1 bacterium]MDZ7340441.1 malectin domain-containing carbohydrate-binding protein [candidate division KSB1 bacterium]
MSKFNLRLLASVVMMALLATMTFSQTIIRVNCGGTAYRDHEGNVWADDQQYSPGSWGWENGGYALFYGIPISGTVDDPLYQAERNALQWYRFTVPNGRYTVTLKFAELYYDGVGERIFHVNIEGSRVLNNFDMVAEAGFAAAIDKVFDVEVSDGRLDIEFITIEKEPGVTIAHANVKAIGVEEQPSHEPRLWVNKDEINFCTGSTKQSFEIKNGGELPLQWSLYEDPDKTWITSVTPTSGTLNQSQVQVVDVYVSRVGMQPAEYEGKITITSNGGNDNVKVLMEVAADKPLSEVKPANLDFGSLLVKRSFTITNVGTSALNWSVKNSNDQPWVKEILPKSGQLASGHQQLVEVTIDRTGLADTTYQGTIRVETNAGNHDIKLAFNTQNKPLHINCGGSQLTDKNNSSWLEDLGHVGGQAVTSKSPIANTEDDAIYQSARQGMTKYQLPLQNNGLFKVTLHFAELQLNIVGERIFNVTIEDSLVLNKFDILAQVGPNAACSRLFEIPITDKSLDIAFTAEKGTASISGITVFQVPQDPYLVVEPSALDFADSLSTMYFTISNQGVKPLIWRANVVNGGWITAIMPDSGRVLYGHTDSVKVSIKRGGLADGFYDAIISIQSNGGHAQVQAMLMVGEPQPYIQRVNAGGDKYKDAAGNLWSADQPYQKGSWGYVGGDVYRAYYWIKNTKDEDLYQSERWGLKSYIFDVPNGTYQIALHFAEIYFASNGKRIMDVMVEGVTVLDDFDIFAQSGPRTAIVKLVTASVKDGQLNIDFSASQDEPKISAIEVQREVKHPLNLIAVQNNGSNITLTPDQMALLQNYPNPFNPSTSISYQLAAPAHVRLEIFNLQGQRERLLVDSHLPAGMHTATWDGRDANNAPVPSGCYFYRIKITPQDDQLQPFEQVRKMLLMK